jgi:hypothetical protein
MDLLDRYLQAVKKHLPWLYLLAIPHHTYLTLKHPELDQAQYGATLDLVNRSIHLSLECVCAFVFIVLLVESGRLCLDARRKREAAMR